MRDHLHNIDNQFNANYHQLITLKNKKMNNKNKRLLRRIGSIFLALCAGSSHTLAMRSSAQNNAEIAKPFPTFKRLIKMAEYLEKTAWILRKEKLYNERTEKRIKELDPQELFDFTDNFLKNQSPKITDKESLSTELDRCARFLKDFLEVVNNYFEVIPIIKSEFDSLGQNIKTRKLHENIDKQTIPVNKKIEKVIKKIINKGDMLNFAFRLPYCDLINKIESIVNFVDFCKLSQDDLEKIPGYDQLYQNFLKQIFELESFGGEIGKYFKDLGEDFKRLVNIPRPQDQTLHSPSPYVESIGQEEIKKAVEEAYLLHLRLKNLDTSLPEETKQSPAQTTQINSTAEEIHSPSLDVENIEEEEIKQIKAKVEEIYSTYLRLKNSDTSLPEETKQSPAQTIQINSTAEEIHSPSLDVENIEQEVEKLYLRFLDLKKSKKTLQEETKQSPAEDNNPVQKKGFPNTKATKESRTEENKNRIKKRIKEALEKRMKEDLEKQKALLKNGPQVIEEATEEHSLMLERNLAEK
jgi:hypothetical protein